MTAGAATCDTCGRSVDAGAKFCAFCGSNVTVAQARTPTRHVSAVGATQQMHNDLLTRLREATLGEYEVLTELGRGGMATVYLGHDLQLDRKVAIKVMLPSLLEGEGMIDRFKLEARTAAALSHPHIIPIFAVRDYEDLLFFVMKFVEGRPLDSIVKELGKLPVPMAQSILSRIAEALGYAHRKGVVHRDIKPANIMVDVEGMPVVTDFGIAKVQETRGLTMTGATVGTPHYMSPEQCAAGKITGASDQYSLGCVAYEMLVGRLPFQGDSVVSLLYKHCHEPPQPFMDVRPDCPQVLHDAVMKMLAKDPADRFPTMEAAVDAIGNVSLAFDDPLRVRLMELAKAGANLTILKRISTPQSPTPVRSKPTMKRTGHRGMTGAAAAAAAPTIRTTPTPALTQPVKQPKTALWAVIGVAVVAAGFTVWLKPWDRPANPAATQAAASVASLSLDPSAGVLDVGGTLQLNASLRDSANQPVTAPVSWTSADPAIATVTPTGQVSGLAPGVARILASAGGAQNVAQLTVVTPIPVAPAGTTGGAAVRIQVQGAPSTLDVGGSAQLRATPLDNRGIPAADRSVAWSSSSSAIATVSRTGVVGGRSPGSVTLTARSGDVTQRVTLQVVAPTATQATEGPARAVSVAVSAIGTLQVGGTARLTATALGADGRPMPASMSWRSSNPAVATVSEGNVTALSAGTTVITASADGRDGSTTLTVTAPVTVAVTPPPAPPPVSAPAPAPEANPRDAVAAVIQDYARAMESRQISEVRRVYTGMTSAQEQQTGQSLGAMEQLRVRLNISSLDIQGDVANAAVTGEYQFFSRENRRNERLPVRFQATLERGPSGWRIRSIR